MTELEILIEEVKVASQDYYEFGESNLSDSEFDTKLERIRELDPHNPILTQVGHGYSLKGIDEKEKFEHPIPVGSIDKTKDLTELQFFLEDGSTHSTKIDGNSIVCYYKNGNLFKVVTRGTRNIGIERTAKFVNIIPNKIPLNGYIAVRGEAAIKKSNYTIENGFDVSKSSRNAVAGAISRKDDWESVFKYVDFIAYTFIDCETGEDLYSTIDWSKYFNVELQKSNVNDIFSDVDAFKKKYKTDYEYEADGIVFKNGNSYIAFKFEDETGNTKLIDVEWSIGKDQRLTPVAILEPLSLAGAMISRASLGSYSRACEIGCWPVHSHHLVEVIRANEVIPYVTKTIEFSIESNYGDLPTCPVCGKKSEQIGEHVFCVNPECENLNLSRLYNFSEQFYPEGLSDKIIEKFFESEKIYNIFDLLKYNKKFSSKVDGLGDSHTEKINKFLENISTDIDVKVVYKTFLFGAGNKGSQKIVDSGFDIYRYIIDNSEIKKLNSISNFNSNIITELVSKTYLIKEFLNYRKIIQEKTEFIDIKGNYCITGIRFKNEDLALVQKSGWKECSGVSKNTNVLVVKDINSTSSKTQKAKQLGIKIMTVSEFLDLINN